MGMDGYADRYQKHIRYVLKTDENDLLQTNEDMKQPSSGPSQRNRNTPTVMFLLFVFQFAEGFIDIKKTTKKTPPP